MAKKYLLLWAMTMFATGVCTAQKITIKNDIIYIDGAGVAEWKTMQKQPLKYSINAPGGKALITIHSSRMVEEKGSPSYIITFLNDDKQALMVKRSKDDKELITGIVQQGLIKNGAVNEAAEAAFVNKHPLPEGFTDVDKLIEY